MSDLESRPVDEQSRTREFLRLLSEHDPQLRRYIFLLVPHWADSQDIVQELHLRLWDQFDDYDRAKDFGAWARTVAHYLVLTHRKKQSRRCNTMLNSALLETLSQDLGSVSDGLWDERRAALRQCVDKLADDARQLLLRCYEGQESLRQVAERAGRGYEATRKTVFRIRQLLLKCVEATLEEERS